MRVSARIQRLTPAGLWLLAVQTPLDPAGPAVISRATIVGWLKRLKQVKNLCTEKVLPAQFLEELQNSTAYLHEPYPAHYFVVFGTRAQTQVLRGMPNVKKPECVVDRKKQEKTLNCPATGPAQ